MLSETGLVPVFFVFRKDTMAAIVTTVNDAIDYINTLYESDDTPPTSGDADFSVWLALLNISVNIWEQEEGVLWRELFVKLSSAADGSKTTLANTTSYACPTNFVFPASGYVWLGSGTSKVAYKVIPIEEVQAYENDSSHWCYFVQGASPTLELNPNLASTMPASYTISYNYYKKATKLTSGTSAFEMSDPMFAVYYAVSELKKDEGDTSALVVATQKLEAMRVKNIMPTWLEQSDLSSFTDVGFGV